MQRYGADGVDLGPGPGGLTAVTVGAGLRGFVPTVPALARLLRALPRMGGVQLAFGWPAARRSWGRLGAQIQRLADTVDVPVWAPQRGGAVTTLPGCAELAVVGPDGIPMGWHAYPPRGAAGWRPGLESDLDGRLVSAGGIAVTAFPSGLLVSVPKGAGAWQQYGRLAAHPTRVLLDLGLLPDGRLAVCTDGGEQLAVGPRQLRQVLVGGGWTGQDLQLLAQPAPGLWPVTADHAAWLARPLQVEIWLPAQGTSWSVDGQGRLRSSAAAGPGWHRAG